MKNNVNRTTIWDLGTDAWMFIAIAVIAICICVGLSILRVCEAIEKVNAIRYNVSSVECKCVSKDKKNE